MEKSARIRTVSIAISAIAFSLTPSAVFAISGCVVSPENPSVILGLIGAGVAAFPFVRAHLRRKGTDAPEPSQL